jgi:hypothetical protein
MSAELQAQLVDQSIIDHINRRHRRIMELGKQALDEAIDIGRDLSEIKTSLDHGQWLPWLEKNAEFTARSATRYMRLWDNRDRLKSDNVSDLSEAYALLSEPKKTSPAAATPAGPVLVDAEVVRFEPTPKPATSWTRPADTEPPAEVHQVHPDDQGIDWEDEGPIQVAKRVMMLMIYIDGKDERSARALDLIGRDVDRLRRKFGYTIDKWEQDNPIPDPDTNRYDEVGWLLPISVREMAERALDPDNLNWKKSAVAFFGAMREMKIITVS